MFELSFLVSFNANIFNLCNGSNVAIILQQIIVANRLQTRLQLQVYFFENQYFWTVGVLLLALGMHTSL